MNILIIEDEVQIGNGLKKFLTKNLKTNITKLATNYTKGLLEYQKDIFDLIILDIYLGKNSKTGLELLKKIKEKNKNIPVIIITGFQEIKYLEEAFKYGANDYIRKPFDIIELSLRVKQWLKLRSTHKIESYLEYENLKFDLNNNKITYENKELNLSKKEKELLKIFLKNPEKLLSKFYIQEKLWGDYMNIDKNRNLRSNIQNLRKSLKCNCKTWIKTIRGEGYILIKNYNV